MINPEAVEAGRVVFFIAACVVAWLFGVLCGAAAMIDFEDRRAVRDNRPKIGLPKHQPVANFTTQHGRRAPLVPVDGERP